MKKVLLLLTIMLICITGCGSKYKTYTEIGYATLAQKLENKDSFVLVLGSESCSACQMYRPVMEKVIQDKQIQIFYVDVSKLTEEDHAKVSSKFALQLTPTTLFFIDGQEKTTYDRFMGAESYDKIVAQLEKYGYIGA